MNRNFKRLSIGVGVALALSPVAQAQWSIGKPGTRQALQGQNRYAYLVMSDPLPGREFDFNDGYQNMHMGDLVQLPGWTGAQRFRLVPVMPRTTQPLYRRGNLIIWDQEGDDLGKIQSESRAARAGGKSRLIPGFDYSPDGPVSTTYQVIGPRVTRPDGKKPFIPDVSDNKTPRPNRYVELDFVEPAAHVSEADFEAALRTTDQRGAGLAGLDGGAAFPACAHALYIAAAATCLHQVSRDLGNRRHQCARVAGRAHRGRQGGPDQAAGDRCRNRTIELVGDDFTLYR